MITYQDIEDAIMGVVQEQLSYVKTTYDKLYTWQPVNTVLRFNGEVWEEVPAPGNSAWRYYGNPNDKYVFDPSKKSIMNPALGDVWIESTGKLLAV